MPRSIAATCCEPAGAVLVFDRRARRQDHRGDERSRRRPLPRPRRREETPPAHIPTVGAARASAIRPSPHRSVRASPDNVARGFAVETGRERSSKPGSPSARSCRSTRVLQKLVETAATLTGARYAALGVLDPSGQRLERFLTTGVDRGAARGDRRPAARAAASSACSSAMRRRCACTTRRRPPLRRLSARPSADARRSSACRSRCAASPTATSTSPRRRAAPTSPTRTRRPSCMLGRAGGGGDRERAPVRVGDALVGAARVAERGR